MRRIGICLTLAAVLGSAGCSAEKDHAEGSATPHVEETPLPAEEFEIVRNPFGFDRDVPEVQGADVLEFAANVEMTGGPEDPNAAEWAEAGTETAFDSIDGEWSGRWRMQGREWTTGTATIKTVGDHVYVHYKDEEEYLIECVRQGDRLVGRYVELGGGSGTTPWAGLIVANDRIDGHFGYGPWDFRRKAAGD